MPTRAAPLGPVLAGVLAVGLALAVGEVAAALVPGVASPVAAVGQQVIPLTPPTVEAWAIRTFGTADKAVLEAGTTVIALAVGGATGILARRRWSIAAGVFLAFGLLGVLAVTAQPDASPAGALAVLAVAVAAGLWALRVLSARLPPGPGRPAPEPVASRLTAPARAPDPPDPAGSPGEGSPTDPPLARRSFLGLAAGIGVAAVIGGAGARLALAGAGRVEPVDVTLPPPARSLPGPGPDHDLGIDGLSPVLTPNDRFFRIDTALRVPRVDPETWTLRVHGLVDRELELAYRDLLAEPLVEVDAAMVCVSNEVGGDLVGTARWLGVRLDDLLSRAGIDPRAEQVVGRAVDGFTAGFPAEAALDGRDALVAVGMNGAPLPARHGFPARLVVPGLYGYVSATKWLAEIELTTWEGFDGYWVPRGWAKRAPVKTASRIDVPRADDRPLPAGETVVAGVAWAPTRGISGVEVEIDDTGWRQAELSRPLSDDAWVQWRAVVELPAGEHRLRVRATDGAGGTQPQGPVPPRPDGAEGWHTVVVRAV